MIEMLKLSEKLLPCPFCGCKATFVKHSAGMPGTQGYDKWDAVACKHCRATVGACDRRFRCLDDAMAAWNRRATPQPAQQADGYLEQHARDSAELRSLCQARDHARRERDAARAEVAGLTASTGHLSAMVDGQTRLVQKAVGIMKALHESATPIDGPDMDAQIPGHALAVFVDGHAELMHALATGPLITSHDPAQQAREPMTGARKQKVLELFDQLQGHYNRESVGFHCIEEVKQLLGLADAATPQAGQGGEGA